MAELFLVGWTRSDAIMAVLFRLPQAKRPAWLGPTNEKELAQWAMFCDRCDQW